MFSSVLSFSQLLEFREERHFRSEHLTPCITSALLLHVRDLFISPKLAYPLIFCVLHIQPTLYSRLYLFTSSILFHLVSSFENDWNLELLLCKRWVFFYSHSSFFLHQSLTFNLSKYIELEQWLQKKVNQRKLQKES